MTSRLRDQLLRLAVRVALLCAIVSAISNVALPYSTRALAQPSNAKAVLAPPQLLRYPYLTDVVGSSATVNLATNSASPVPVIQWGVAGHCLTSAAATTGVPVKVRGNSEWQFKAHIGPLAGNTAYCYRASQGGVDLLGADASPIFTAALPAGNPTSYSFAVLGDWGAGTPDEANVLSQIDNSPASFVVTTGDNVYNNGTQSDYGDLVKGRVFGSGYWKQPGTRHPAFLSQGNHGFGQPLPYLQNWPQDIAVQTSGGTYRADSFCGVGKLPQCPSTMTYTDAWYAFDWGLSRFYVLDAAWDDNTGGYLGDFQAHWNGPVVGCPACGTELQWLKQDLASHARTRHKFAFFHYPMRADGGHSSDTFLQGPKGLEGLLASNGVGIVFNGHSHIYERNLPQIPGSPMVNYIAGAGGRTLSSVNRCSPFDAYALGSASSCHAPMPTSAQDVFHFILVTVSGNQVTVTPTNEKGITFDVQTYLN